MNDYKRIVQRLGCYFHSVELVPDYENEDWSVEVCFFKHCVWLDIPKNFSITGDQVAGRLMQMIERLDNETTNTDRNEEHAFFDEGEQPSLF